MGEMIFCSIEQAEFPASEFELIGTQWIHKHKQPRHNTLGEVIGEVFDDGTIPGVDAIPASQAETREVQADAGANE